MAQLADQEIGGLGLKVTPSVANFVLIHFPLEPGKTSAEADVFLTKRGLVLRALNNYGLPHALRMTIGTEDANRLVVDGLRDFMARHARLTVDASALDDVVVELVAFLFCDEASHIG